MVGGIQQAPAAEPDQRDPQRTARPSAEAPEVVINCAAEVRLNPDTIAYFDQYLFAMSLQWLAICVSFEVTPIGTVHLERLNKLHTCQTLYLT